MSKVVVFHDGMRWYVPAGDSMREVPYALVSEWQRQYELDIKEVEGYE